MARISFLGLLLSIGLLSAACTGSSSDNPTPTFVTDTLGNVFSMSCSSSLCSLTPQNPNLKPVSCDSQSNATDAFALVWGTQILTVHVVSVPSAGTISLNAAEPAHPVACATDQDCAPNLLSSAYTCVNGLCQHVSASTPMLTVDVIALCQADIKWPLSSTSCPYLTEPTFAKRMAKVAEICGSTVQCANVPADCRQPVASPAPDGGVTPVVPEIDGGASAVDGGT